MKWERVGFDGILGGLAGVVGTLITRLTVAMVIEAKRAFVFLPVKTLVSQLRIGRCSKILYVCSSWTGLRGG